MDRLTGDPAVPEGQQATIERLVKRVANLQIAHRAAVQREGHAGEALLAVAACLHREAGRVKDGKDVCGGCDCDMEVGIKAQHHRNCPVGLAFTAADRYWARHDESFRGACEVLHIMENPDPAMEGWVDTEDLPDDARCRCSGGPDDGALCTVCAAKEEMRSPIGTPGYDLSP